MLTLADDSGLEIEALGGAPGVHSKRFFPGTEAERNQKILEMLSDKTDRSARAVSVLCLYNPITKNALYFEGILRGQIGFEEKGQEGFGFDTIFIPNGQEKSLAELGISYKNKISHRAQALQKLVEYLKSNILVEP